MGRDFKEKNVYDSSPGFTMLELVVMIALLSILVVAAVVSFDLGSTELDKVVNILRSDIQYAQEQAMTQGSEYGFRSIDATNYEIFEGSVGSPATNPLTLGDMLVDISPIQFQGVVATITFDSGGIPDNVSDANIQLTDGSKVRTITVIANTGVVTITY